MNLTLRLSVLDGWRRFGQEFPSIFLTRLVMCPMRSPVRARRQSVNCSLMVLRALRATGVNHADFSHFKLRWHEKPRKSVRNSRHPFACAHKTEGLTESTAV